MSTYKVEICGVNTAKLPVLKEAEKEELFAKIKSGDQDARDTYIQGNLRLVLSVIKRFHNHNENVDDLFQIGCIGLMKAIDNFDVTVGVKFSTYAVPMIVGEIRRYLRDNSSYRIPRSLRDIAYKAMQAKEALSRNSQKEPTLEEIAEESGISVEDIVYALDAIQTPLSLFDPVYTDGGDTLYVMDQISDKKNKEEIIEGLNQVPMKLPHTKGITINNEIFAFIRSEWTNTEVEVKTIKPEYELKIEYMKLDILEVFNKCLSPPLVATLIGIILSVSNVRSLIYDTKNNYWSNLVDGVSMIAQTYTPLIFGLMGLSSVTANTDISELLASKVHVAVIMIIRFLIMPFLGMFNIYMWKEYYGGIVKESTAYRLLMFTHWCLPSASNMTLIINMTKYFGNEYGYLILICNMFCIIGLSVLNLLYFVIVGL